MAEVKSSRIVVITPEMPLPAIHGGRVDVARRLSALKARGVDVMMICWARSDEEERLAHSSLRDIVHSFVILRESSLRKYLLEGFRYPLWVGQRWIPSRRLSQIVKEIDEFAPTALLLDHLNGAAGLELIRSKMSIPYAYRSHNVEEAYAQQQTRYAKSLREQITGFLVRKGIAKLENRIRRDAFQVLDISADDLSHWQAKGATNSHWSPVLIDADNARELSEELAWKPSFDVGYLGNLHSPNNVAGVLWFIAQVVPRLRKVRPNISIQIAGSNPTSEIYKACIDSKLNLLPNPISSLCVLRDSKVLVNPVFAASGTNVKAVEMMFTPAALISTSFGLTGLPKTAKDCFSVADEAEQFALHILSGRQDFNRDAARGLFGEAALTPFLGALQKLGEQPI